MIGSEVPQAELHRIDLLMPRQLVDCRLDHEGVRGRPERAPGTQVDGKVDVLELDARPFGRVGRMAAPGNTEIAHQSGRSEQWARHPPAREDDVAGDERMPPLRDASCFVGPELDAVSGGRAIARGSKLVLTRPL